MWVYSLGGGGTILGAHWHYDMVKIFTLLMRYCDAFVDVSFEKVAQCVYVCFWNCYMIVGENFTFEIFSCVILGFVQMDDVWNRCALIDVWNRCDWNSYSTFVLSWSSWTYSGSGISGMFHLRETGCNGHVSVHGNDDIERLTSRAYTFVRECREQAHFSVLHQTHFSWVP